MALRFRLAATARTRRGDHALQIALADRWPSRLRGLMFSPPLRREGAATQALLLTDCTAVHGCFIGEPLDIAFLDERGLVVQTTRLARYGLARGSRARHGRPAHTLELPAGSMARLGLLPGDWLLPAIPDSATQTRPLRRWVVA